MQLRDLVLREVARRPERVEARAPERLVRVDVPEAGDHPLVEEHGLEGRLAARELTRRATRDVNREPSGSGPFFAARYGSRSGSSSDEPRAEPAHVAVGEPRAVVELEHRPLVRDRPPVEAAGHPQVHEEPEPTLEPEHEVLPAPLDGDARDRLRALPRSRRGRTAGSGADRGSRRARASAPRAAARAAPGSSRPRAAPACGPYGTTSSRMPCSGGGSSPISYAASTALDGVCGRLARRARAPRRARRRRRRRLHASRGRRSPTAWSIESSFVRRPAPSSRLAMPTASAPRRVTTPVRRREHLAHDGRRREHGEVGIATLRADPALVRRRAPSRRPRPPRRVRDPRRRRSRDRRARAAARTRRGRAR